MKSGLADRVLACKGIMARDTRRLQLRLSMIQLNSVSSIFRSPTFRPAPRNLFILDLPLFFQCKWWSFWLHHTWRKNYAIESFILLAQYYILFPLRMAEQLKWGRFVNTHRKPVTNIPADLHTEHLNKDVKTAIAGLGSNVTEIGSVHWKVHWRTSSGYSKFRRTK